LLQKHHVESREIRAAALRLAFREDRAARGATLLDESHMQCAASALAHGAS
jgi:hypothetical protein